MGQKRKEKEIVLALGVRVREGNEGTRGAAKWAEEKQEELVEAIGKARSSFCSVSDRSRSTFYCCSNGLLRRWQMKERNV